MARVVLVFLFFAQSVSAAVLSGECKPYEVSVIVNKEKIKSKEVICLDTKTGEMISDHCTTRDCRAYRAKGTVTSDVLRKSMSHIGNPLFAACYQSHGHPEMFQVRIGNQWRDYTRCRYGDHSFIDIGAVFKK